MHLSFLVALAFVSNAVPARALTVQKVVVDCLDEECYRQLQVTAEPGERNNITVRTNPAGNVEIREAGAPLRAGAGCESSGPGAVNCGRFEFGAVIALGDGDDRLLVEGITGEVDGGPGADAMRGAGAATSLSVSYAGRTAGVSVSVGDGPNDGAAGEGDDVEGVIEGLRGGRGDDRLAGALTTRRLLGGDGDDVLTAAAPVESALLGEAGDDVMRGGPGGDTFVGGAGADVFAGGGGRDRVTYTQVEEPFPFDRMLTIGDGPNDGVAGERDDVREDVEDVEGGPGDDVIVGNGQANVLEAGSGSDVVRGGAGADRLVADQSDAEPDLVSGGSGRDVVDADGWDFVRLDGDGEGDRLRCSVSAPRIRFDRLDVTSRCAPEAYLASVDEVKGVRIVRGVGRLRYECDSPSAVACKGRVRVSRRGRTLGRARLPRILPGQRRTVPVRLRGLRLRRGGWTTLRVTTLTQRAEPTSASRVMRLAFATRVR